MTDVNIIARRYIDLWNERTPSRRREILAADRSRTQILGNYQMDYKTKRVNCDGFPWYAQVFMTSHIAIECDPIVWNQVESLIRSKLPAE